MTKGVGIQYGLSENPKLFDGIPFGDVENTIIFPCYVHEGIDELQEERAGNPCVGFKNGMSRQSDPFEQMTRTHPVFQ
jgi:hypothetical protein